MKLNIDSLKNDYQMIHYFGLGFIQLKIDDNLRYHFYHPELTSIVAPEEIHNHRYPFISTILTGKLTQHLYNVSLSNNKDSEFYKVRESCTLVKLHNNDPVPVDILHVSSFTYSKGESYLSLPEEFHTVESEYAITRLYRGDICEKYAEVVKRKGSKDICPFSQQMDIPECWELVNDCILLSNNKQP